MPASYDTATDRLTIKEWPNRERPREKLVERGAAALSDAELLAILIQSGSGQSTAVDLGKKILRTFGSFRGLAKRSLGELTTFRGIGKARASVVMAAIEIGRRLFAEPEEPDGPVHSPEDVARRLIPLLRDLNHEVFYVLLLNTAGKILRMDQISRGTVNASIVHPREVFHAAAIELATSIILVHNHPAGTSEPSREDRELTARLVDAGRMMDIPVRDHIIVCGDAYVSFAERGWI